MFMLNKLCDWYIILHCSVPRLLISLALAPTFSLYTTYVKYNNFFPYLRLVIIIFVVVVKDVNSSVVCMYNRGLNKRHVSEQALIATIFHFVKVLTS